MIDLSPMRPLSRMRSLTRLSVLAAGIALAACVAVDRSAANEFAESAEDFTLTTEGASRPTAAIDPRDGTIYVAWVGTHDGSSDVYLARLDPGADRPTAPVRVNHLPGDAAPHDQAPPRIGVGPDGTLYLVWQNNTTVPGRRFPASDLRFAVSTDRGATFSPAITVNDDVGGPPSSHTFHDMAIARDGTVVISWIDSRASELNGPEIRIARSTDGGHSFSPSRVIDREACPCCRTALAIAPDGSALIAWRKVFAGEVRDVVVAREPDTDDVVTRPTRVHEDRWRIDACPHAGPAILATHQGEIHLAWYTGAEGRAGIYLTSSDDGGLTFRGPSRILAATSLPPSQVALAPGPDGRIRVAWEDRRTPERMVQAGTFHRGEVRGRPFSAPGTNPALAVAAEVAALAWLDDGSVRLRVAR